jgi:hypothetical protein
MKTHSEYYLMNEGIGGFLDPPDYPTHFFSVWGGPKRNPRSMESLESAVRSTYVDAEVREKAQALLDAWHENRPALDSEPVRAWIRDCMRHWRGCWYVETPGEYSSHCASAYGKRADGTHYGKMPFDATPYALHHVQKFYPEVSSLSDYEGDK